MTAETKAWKRKGKDTMQSFQTYNDTYTAMTAEKNVLIFLINGNVRGNLLVRRDQEITRYNRVCVIHL